MYCPFLMVSPSRTGRSRRSPERFEESFTCVAACSFPAAATLRVMAPFFTWVTCTCTGGSFLGMSEAPTMPTTARTKTAATMRWVQDMRAVPFLQGAAHGPVQVGAGDDGVDAGLEEGQLRLGELEHGVADLELRGGAGLEAGGGEPQALLRRPQVLRGHHRGAGEGDVGGAGASDLAGDLLQGLLRPQAGPL